MAKFNRMLREELLRCCRYFSLPINKTKAVKIVDDRTTQTFLRFVEDLELLNIEIIAIQCFYDAYFFIILSYFLTEGR